MNVLKIVQKNIFRNVVNETFGICGSDFVTSLSQTCQKRWYMPLSCLCCASGWRNNQFCHKACRNTTENLLDIYSGICWSYKIHTNSVDGSTHMIKSRQSNHVSKPPWKILFFGTDKFAVEHLRALCENRFREDSVVKDVEVMVSSHKGDIFKYADSQGLKILDWPTQPAENEYDVGVVVSFGHLIPQSVISQFPQGVLNVHGSLLPRWRGAAPMMHTILNGDTHTGLTIMEVRPKKFDIGPILAQHTVPVPEGCTTQQLTDLLAKHGPPLLLSTLKCLNTVEKKSQKREDATLASKLNVSHARVDWINQTCESIGRQYRALGEMYSLRSEYKGKSVRLGKMVLNSQMEGIAQEIKKDNMKEGQLHAPGTPVFHFPTHTLCIKCKDGLVGFHKITIKKTMTALAFYNGYLTKEENSREIFVSLPNGLDYIHNATARSHKPEEE